MSKVIERLRSQRAVIESEMGKRGCEAGREWVMADYCAATYSQLKKLELLGLDCPFRDEVLDSPHPGRSMSEFMEIEFDELWEPAIGDDHEMIADDRVFVLAFVDGALDTWLKIRDQVEC